MSSPAVKTRTVRGRPAGAARAVAIVLAVALDASSWAPATAQAPLSAVENPDADLQRAGWTLVTASDETLVYMKDAPGLATNGSRRAYTLYDSARIRDRKGFVFRSVRSLSEFQCAQQLTRVVKETFFEKRALHGAAWEPPTFVPTDWAAPEAGSVGELRMAFACRNRTLTQLMTADLRG
jgi:hypothetical protein